MEMFLANTGMVVDKRDYSPAPGGAAHCCRRVMGRCGLPVPCDKILQTIDEHFMNN